MAVPDSNTMKHFGGFLNMKTVTDTVVITVQFLALMINFALL